MGDQQSPHWHLREDKQVRGSGCADAVGLQEDYWWFSMILIRGCLFMWVDLVDIIILISYKFRRWLPTTLCCPDSRLPKSSRTTTKKLVLKNSKATEMSTMLSPPNTFCPGRSNLLSLSQSARLSYQHPTTISTPRALEKLPSSTNQTGWDWIDMSSDFMDTSKSPSWKPTAKTQETEKLKC